MIKRQGAWQTALPWPGVEPARPVAPHKTSCQICRTRAWTPQLFASLVNLPAQEKSLSWSYTVATKELRDAVFAGCGFCSTIANGIHGSIEHKRIASRFLSLDETSSENETADHVADSQRTVKEEAEHDTEDLSALIYGNDAETWLRKNASGVDSVKENDRSWPERKNHDLLMEDHQLTVNSVLWRDTDGHFTLLTTRLELDNRSERVKSGAQRETTFEGIELGYRMNVSGVDPFHIFQIKLPGDTLGSETNMRKMRAWVSSLDLGAVERSAASELPARLIDLRVTKGLRIVNTTYVAPKELQFAALSYVWGANQTFVLLSRNKSLLKSSFDVSQLPRTIQDAIAVTRCVGFRYIWIDALCIIQDSAEDKARELPKMRLIYKHAAITLVASIASAAPEGFLHHVEDPHYLLNPISVPYQVQASDMSLPDITLSWPARYMGLSDPINGRAWTFQEFLLSSRAIVFSYGGISMIDRSDTTSKNGFTAGKSSELNELPWNDLLLSLDRTDNPRDTWLKIRGEYSSRRLSYALDKLPAFSAVAEEFGRANGWDYCAGLWRHELLDDLQWSSLSYEDVSSNEVTLSPRPQQYVAPSWSWASVDARITASVFPTPEAAHKSHRVFKGYLDFEIISCQAQLTSANYLYGPVGSGMLIAKGRIFLMIWEPYSEHRWQTVASIQGREEDGSLLSLSDEVGRQGGAIVDAFDAALRAGVTVTCLATRIVEEKLDGGDRTEGLMLLPVGIGANTYRRVGFFRMDELLPFEQVRAEVISII